MEAVLTLEAVVALEAVVGPNKMVVLAVLTLEAVVALEGGSSRRHGGTICISSTSRACPNIQ